MADREIPDLTAATTPLSGAEEVHISQGGNSRRATLSDVAAIATGAMLKVDYDPDANGIIAVAQGGTNAATASGARTNLGLGTMAVQNAATVNITGGSITGITDLTVADGGTGASDASTARTNLGLAIGTDVQAYSANLAGFAATTVANVQNRDNHTGTQLASTISDFSTAADLRITAAVGVSVQAYDALLSSVSGLSLTAGDIIYATGADAVASLPVGAAGQVLAVNGSGEPAWDTSLVVGGLIAANNLSDVDDADTSLDNLGFGGAGKDISAFSLAADVRNYLDVAPYVADRTALKALDTTKDTVVRLVESGREGVFKWTSGDFSTHVAADTQEGIYVKATAIAATSGAWVRETQDGIWFWRWFGITAQSVGGTDMAPNINAFMAIANIVKPWWVLMGVGLFPCDSRITTPTFQLRLEGTLSGSQQTILYKRSYTEATTGRGLISAVTHGIQLRNIVFSAGSGSGGSYVSVISGAASLIGDTLIENCNLGGDNFSAYGLYVDGSLNQTAGPGVRDMRVVNTTIFGHSSGALYLRTVRGFWCVGCNILTSGGSSSTALEVTGITSYFSDIVNISGGGISGQISLDKCSNVLIDIPSLSSNVVNTSDVTASCIRAGIHASGTLEHDWTGGSWYDIGANYRDRVAAYLSPSVNDVTGAGGTPYTLKYDTISQHLKNWEGSQNYDTSTGRYTAKYSGDHEFDLQVSLLGITSVHTRYILKAEQYTSGGVAITAGTRTKTAGAFNNADAVGQLTIDMHCKIQMSVGDYVIFTLFIEQVGGAGSAVVDFRGGSDRWSTFDARLVG